MKVFGRLISLAVLIGSMAASLQVEAKSNLAQDETLYPNTELTSPNGAYSLRMQSDGNLVLYDNSNGQATWASNTDGYWGLHAVMQGDGNLVLYDDYGYAYWESGSDPTVGPELNVQDDGNLVIYGLAPVWESHTAWGECGLHANYNIADAVIQTSPVFSWTYNATGGLASALPNSAYYFNGYLLSRTHLVSQNGCYTLWMQEDGNLVAYRTTDNAVVWASNSEGHGNSAAVLQSDGNFVVYQTATIAATWSSVTNGYQGRALIMQNDGNIVLYTGRVARWQKTGFGYGQVINYSPQPSGHSLWSIIFGDGCYGISYDSSKQDNMFHGWSGGGCNNP